MKAFKLLAAIATLTALASAQPLLADTTPGRWLVAQETSCVLDGRRVPIGANYCREGRMWVCSGSGTWTNTNKPC